MLWDVEDGKYVCVECGSKDAGGCIARACVTVADDEPTDDERPTIPCPPPAPKTPRNGNGRSRQVPGQTWSNGSPMALPCDRPTLRPFPAVVR